ncbi:unnamed protein product [Medioppia subpectinata]|uniref:Poly A polymerase head domain-containing protein n=1 Tax=Medioppia subpectinata TaxID=1979941 RepID=A0A7R9KGM0_9ACAR|nr:unnamed protein product [Medioppia subpectinata]CAG2102995.1 unnamed protein product [Medioppia subpectinata]
MIVRTFIRRLLANPSIRGHHCLSCLQRQQHHHSLHEGNSSGGSCLVSDQRITKAEVHRKIPDKQFRPLFDELVAGPDLRFLDTLFARNGYQLRIAGGAVRDLLCGQRPVDVDLATDATPDQMKDMIRDRTNIWALNTSSGARNGTIMARVNDRTNYEITALRKWTDERPGLPVFVTDWSVDAAHRDLTINAMYLDFTGCLYDYFDGVGHLRRRAICFVGDGTGLSAIRQNPITIMRYMRFHCRYGGHGCGHDSRAITTIREQRHLLRSVDSQTLWSELKKLLSVNGCVGVVDLMLGDLQMGEYFGLSDQSLPADSTLERLREFRAVHDRLSSAVASGRLRGWDGLTLLAALVLKDWELPSAGADMSVRLSLSNTEKRVLAFVVHNRRTFAQTSAQEWRRRIVLATKDQQQLLRRQVLDCALYCGHWEVYDQIKRLVVPDFPPTGHLFAAIGRPVPNRAALKGVLNELKLFWADSDFQCTDDDLKTHLESVLRDIDKK